jgi:hypothetical protein
LPRHSQPENWYERLDEDTRAIVLAIGLVIFLLLLAFFLSNPILAAVVLGSLGLIVFTIYSKHKTGTWWFRTSFPEGSKTSRNDAGDVGGSNQTHPQTSGKSFGTTAQPSLRSGDSFAQPFRQSFIQLDIDQQVEYLTRAIQDFHPPRNPPNEVAYHDMLVSNLQTNYPDIKLHRQIGSEIDAVVGRIGIEAKLWLRKQEADRLYSQIDTFLHDGYVDRLVVVLYQPTPQWQNYLNEKLARRGWLQGQVRVITV